jgi:hypothetical protein
MRRIEWKLVQHRRPHLGFGVHVTLPNGGQSDEIAFVCCPGNEEATVAYAKLIVAAPELLAACKALLDCPAMNLDNVEPADCAAFNCAQAVVAKVEGKV